MVYHAKSNLKKAGVTIPVLDQKLKKPFKTEFFY